MVILSTERLILRQFVGSDAEAMSRVLGDAEVMRYGEGALDPESVRGWIRDRIAVYQERPNFGLWALVIKGDENAVGYCGLTLFPDVNGSPETEIGYRLAQAVWGNGYATEAALAVRDYAFDKLKLAQVIALVDPRNVASIRVAQKMGMSHVADYTMDGYTHADYVFAVHNKSLNTDREDAAG